MALETIIYSTPTEVRGMQKEHIIFKHLVNLFAGFTDLLGARVKYFYFL